MNKTITRNKSLPLRFIFLFSIIFLLFLFFSSSVSAQGFISPTSYRGNFSFNGGWENGGFSIVDGNIYAQTGFFYNITSLNVTKQNLTVISDLILNGFSPGSVLFIGSNNQISQDNSNLFWDDSNDRLGVGTTTPLVKFHLSGGTPTTADEMLLLDRPSSSDYLNAIIGTAGSGIKFGDNNRFFIGVDTYANRDAFTFGTELLTVLANGNVGIGTNNPVENLHVEEVGGQAAIVLESDADQTIQFRFLKSGGLKWALFISDNSDDLTFFDTAARVTFQGGGNVGINTTTPQNTLNVIGDTNLTGSLLVVKTISLAVLLKYIISVVSFLILKFPSNTSKI